MSGRVIEQGWNRPDDTEGCQTDLTACQTARIRVWYGTRARIEDILLIMIIIKFVIRILFSAARPMHWEWEQLQPEVSLWVCCCFFGAWSVMFHVSIIYTRSNRNIYDLANDWYTWESVPAHRKVTPGKGAKRQRGLEADQSGTRSEQETIETNHHHHFVVVLSPRRSDSQCLQQVLCDAVLASQMKNLTSIQSAGELILLKQVASDHINLMHL